MKRTKSKGTSLTLLGRSETKLPVSPAEARLETFPNPTRRNYHIHFETDDFTCLCPVTGQPDFARIDIDRSEERRVGKECGGRVGAARSRTNDERGEVS